MNPELPPIAAIDKQSEWYGAAARRNQKMYRILKFIQIVLAAAIPIVALSGANVYERWASALMGGFIGVIEGVSQLGQYQQNWLLYRATREALKRESFLHSANAGPYAGIDNPDAAFIERCDAILSGESVKWLSTQQQAALGQKK